MKCIRDGGDEFGNLNPNNGVEMPDMLQAGMLSSLEGVSQTLKNTSLDLRGDCHSKKRRWTLQCQH